MDRINVDKFPELEVTQEELKQLVAFAGIMAIGIHYGVDPEVNSEELPEEIENSGGMLGLMIRTLRASIATRDLLAEIIERAEAKQKAEIDSTAEMLLSEIFRED
jgi:hypothetical protein